LSAATPARRVLILHSDIGEGHLAAARALQLQIQLEEPLADVVLEDGYQVLGPFLRWFMRDFYHWQLTHFPRLYWFAYGLFSRVPLLRLIGALLMWGSGAKAALRLVRRYSPDLVVSTDARLNAILGGLRRSGRLKVPLVATLTDLAGLEFWAHKGVDLHLVMHHSCRHVVERIAGKGSVALVRPLVAPSFHTPLPRRRAREVLGLPTHGRMVLVSGGGWGVGDFEGAIRAALELPGATVVCVSGRNESARLRLEAVYSEEPRLFILGYTSRMNELLAACDAVVHSTGGLTFLEAVVRKRPVIAYRPPFGHPTAIASVLAKHGLQRSVNKEEDLAASLGAAFNGGHPEEAWALGNVTAARAALEARPRVSPVPTWKVHGVRVAVASLIVFMLAVFALMTDEPYPVFARAFHLRDASIQTTGSTSVGLVIEADQTLVPAIVRELAAHGDRASFAYDNRWRGDAIQTVSDSGDQILPSLGQGSLLSWIRTRSTLAKEASNLGTRSPEAYVAADDGFSLGEYLLARTRGALPLPAAVRLNSNKLRADFSVRGGDVVVVRLDSGAAPSLSFLKKVLDRLAAKGLTGLPAVSSIQHHS
jgi:processive 1,2-diacylglycerol beta-glucosyltransferase